MFCHWKLLLTSGTQKAIPHPLGSSRSHPAPHEFISCPTCLPGCCTSRMGTRPCSGVGLNLEPGTSTSLRMRFNSCRGYGGPQVWLFPAFGRQEQVDTTGGEGRDLLWHLVFSDVVAHGLLPQVTLTAALRYTSQRQLPPLVLVHL